jgi:rhodanese-related sulfurtransferase
VKITPRALGVAALGLGALAALAGEARPPRGIERAAAEEVANEVARDAGQLAPLELAGWIRDRVPGLQVVDLRSAEEFDDGHVPTARRASILELAELAGGGTVVLYGSGEQAAQAWVLFRLLRHDRAYFLRGGWAGWEAEVLHPVLAESLPPSEYQRLADLSRYFGGTPHSGSGPEAISAFASVPARTPPPARRRSGGC